MTSQVEVPPLTGLIHFFFPAREGLRERSKYNYKSNKLVNKPKPCENKYDEQ